MAKFALYVRLVPKFNKASDVEAYLTQGAATAQDEPGTLHWYALKQDDGAYSIFITFEEEAGRDAHLNGAIVRALRGAEDTLFEGPLVIDKVTILADCIKSSGGNHG